MTGTLTYGNISSATELPLARVIFGYSPHFQDTLPSTEADVPSLSVASYQS